MKRNYLFYGLILILAITAACKENHSDLDDGLYAEFKTNYGDFVAELYYEQAPMTAANFVSLAEGTNPGVSEEYEGKKFFDSLAFHRIVDGFVIQGGDPHGTGEGGPGYEFANEIDDSLSHSKGTLSMANAGPDTNGSQFFIMLEPRPDLDGGYSVFGQTIKGQKIVDSIGKVEVDQSDRPKEDVVMEQVQIIRKGQEAKNFDAPEVFMNEMEEREKVKAEEEKKIKEELDELAEGYETTDSGLRYKITSAEEDGKKPKAGDEVQVFYKGILSDGKVFDQRLEEDQDPIAFEVGIGQVIPGWDEGLQLMREGEEARFIIPPHLGYGPNEMGPIPGNSILIFDVKMDKIK